MIDNDRRHESTGFSVERGTTSNDSPSSEEILLGRKRKRLQEDSTRPATDWSAEVPRHKDHPQSLNGSLTTEAPDIDDEEAEIKRRRALRAKIQAKYEFSSSLQEVKSSISGDASPARSPYLSLDSPTSPASFKDEPFELSKADNGNLNKIQGESAADYDPDQDRINEHEQHRQVAVASAYGVLVREDSSAQESNQIDEDDMFASPKPPQAEDHSMNAAEQNIAKKLDASVLDSWADTEGYYRIMIGELLNNQYAVQAILGKGVFSSVVRCVDQASGEVVAIKVIRNNDVMRKAGLKEIDLLEKLMQADPHDTKHIVRLRLTFEHRNHLCLVFESLSLNLREVLRKFGKDVGISLKAVRAYAQQIFLALSLLRKCNIMHADVKPDNILVSESRMQLKLCDLGSASDVLENTPTPYLASRFYRAPEVILGIPYDTAMDIWAVGCTLYELYTGKILFPGRSNNQMLRLFMECRGKMPSKLLKKAIFAGSHFDEEHNFNSSETNKVTGEQVTRVLNITKPVNDLRTRLMTDTDAVDRPNILVFVDLLERCLDLDPAKRCSANEALKHRFFNKSK